MTAEAIDVRIDRELAWSRSRNPNTYITSPSFGGYRSELILQFGRDSTTIARTIENLECVIIGQGVSLRGRLLGKSWVIDTDSATVIAESTAHEIPAFDTAQDTQWLRTSLELSMAEIASLFGVTRKAVYDWLDGTKTSKAAYIRAVRSLIESQIPVETRPYLRQFWNSPSVEGLSLFEIIKSGDPTRLPEPARAALSALAGPMSNYIKQLASKTQVDVQGHTHNDDLYRSL
jgi:DNA-binding transcriptional regulator YiaG